MVNTNEEVDEEDTEYQELMNEADNDIFLSRSYEKFDNYENWQNDEEEEDEKRDTENEEVTEFILDEYPFEL